MTSKQTQQSYLFNMEDIKSQSEYKDEIEKELGRDGMTGNHCKTDWTNPMGQFVDISQEEQTASWEFVLTQRT